MERRQALLAGSLMLGAALAADRATPRKLLAQIRPIPPLADLLPQASMPWAIDHQGPTLLVPDDVKALLDKLYQQTYTQVFRREGHSPVMLAMAYGGDQSDATKAHRPEVCYPAQGFSVSGSQKVILKIGGGPEPCLLPTRRLVARMQSRHEPLSYWICVGDTIATDGLEQKWAQMRYGLRGWVPDGLLVRVSTLDRQAERSWATQQQFLSDWFSHASAAIRQRVFGQVGPHE